MILFRIYFTYKINKMDGEKVIKVDIWSDIACPWCYVGETNFKIARDSFLKSNPNVKIETIFHAYMIDPATKEEGEEYLAYNRRRWGGDGWTYSLREAGKKIGCNFANWKTWPNTYKGHTLIAAGKKIGKGEEVLDEIFNQCYEEGQNVSLEDTLNKIADKFGIKEWNTKENQKSVVRDDQTGKRAYDIHGVPYFIIGKYVLEGAQPPKAFLSAFTKSM